MVEISPEPNGHNINKENQLEAQIPDFEAYCGLKFDGDADRLIIINEIGEKIDGDDMLAFLAEESSNIVGTEMTNQGLVEYLSNNGSKLFRADVGEKNVFDLMVKSDAKIGGEPSGHIIPLCCNCYTSDAIVTALLILNKLSSAKLSAVNNLFKKYNQHIAKIPICENIDAIDTSYAAALLGPRGRINIRKSGTEPIVRIMLETDIMSLDLKKIAEELIKINRL